MRRSRESARADAVLASDFPRTVRKSPTAGRRSSRTVPCLATVPPRDWNAERDVKTAERRRHDPVVPRWRSEQGESPGEHEADPHHWHDSHRECATRHHSRTIKEQPQPGNRLDDARAVKDDRQQRPDKHGWRKTENEFAARP